MNNGKDVNLMIVHIRNSTGPSSCSSHSSLFTNAPLAACLDRSQDHNAEEILISTNQDPSSSLRPGWCRPTLHHVRVHEGSLITVVAAVVGSGQMQVGQAEQANAGRTEKTVNHRDKSEPPGHYITSPLRGGGCTLMTLWWMTDSGSIRWGDGSQQDGTGHWTSWKLLAQGFEGNILMQKETCWWGLCISAVRSVEHLFVFG